MTARMCCLCGKDGHRSNKCPLAKYLIRGAR